MSAMATRSIRHIPVALRSMNHGRAASARCYSSLYAPVDDGRARRGDPVHDLVGDGMMLLLLGSLAITPPIAHRPCTSQPPSAEQPGLYGLGVKSIATRNVKRGEVIFHEAGPSTDKPTMHSIQVSVDKHVAIMGEGRYTGASLVGLSIGVECPGPAVPANLAAPSHPLNPPVPHGRFLQRTASNPTR